MLATSNVYGSLLDIAADRSLRVDILLVDGVLVSQIAGFEYDNDKGAEFVGHAEAGDEN